MTSEQQCVNLELSKRLNELDFKQESLFYWEQDPVRYADEEGIKISGWEDGWILQYITIAREVLHAKVYQGHIIPAYTVAELGEFVKKYRKEFDQIDLEKVGISKEISDDSLNAPDFMFDPNFYAKCLIYLRNNNLI